MTAHPFTQAWTRRRFLHTAGVAAAAVGTGAAAAGCGSAAIPGALPDTSRSSQGGRFTVGVAGGSVKDTLDAHAPVAQPDEARVFNLYDTLVHFDPDYTLVPGLAEEFEPSSDATVWTFRLRSGLQFHNGAPVTAADVAATVARIVDPADPKSGAAGLAAIDIARTELLDSRTVRFHLHTADVTLADTLAQFSNGIVPADYDPRQPLGTGPFRASQFQPGIQSVFTRNPYYWREGEPHVDELAILDFPDDTARVNALLGGQVDAIAQLPVALFKVIEATPGFHTLTSETGSWIPFTMRVDIPPFDDPRVREAMRLLVNRQEMIDQVLSGRGGVGNDIYGRFDTDYNTTLPQRTNDPDRARQLLAQAGFPDGLTVELVTSPAAAGMVDAAQVFVTQARKAGVTVNLRKVDQVEFYGDNYLSWPFAQDYWSTRNFLPQTARGSMPNSPYNETHWAEPQFISLVNQARQTVDPIRRRQLVHEAQRIEYDSGGYIVWGFPDMIDAYSDRVRGLVPDRGGFPLSSYQFRRVSLSDDLR